MVLKVHLVQIFRQHFLQLFEIDSASQVLIHLVIVLGMELKVVLLEPNEVNRSVYARQGNR